MEQQLVNKKTILSFSYEDIIAEGNFVAKEPITNIQKAKVPLPSFQISLLQLN